jgi:hypothetical protein
MWTIIDLLRLVRDTPAVFKRLPRPIVAFVAIVLTLIITLAPAETHPGAPSAVAILLVTSAGLVLGFGPAWLFLVAVELGNLAVAIDESQPLNVVVMHTVLIALLLARSTRRHLWWRRPFRQPAA